MNARRPFAFAACALAALVALATASAGDGAPARPVRFVPGFDAARVAARERGVPLFVYVRSDQPPCEVCLALEADVFEKPESGRLDAVCVCVRIGGGDAPAPDAAAFLTRYDVDRVPTLLVMNADGHVVVSDVGRTLPAMLAAVDRAVVAETEFAEARRGADADSGKALLDLLWRRMAWDEFLPLAQPKAAADPAIGARVAAALLRVGRTDDARAAWRRLAERFPTHEDRPEWLVREIACEIDAAAGRRAFAERLVPAVKALGALAGRAEATKDAALAARAWIEVARLEFEAGIEGAALWYYDKAIAAAPGTRFEATALWGRHTLQFRRRDYAGAKASCERILKEFPSSPEAKLAPPEIEKCDEMLGR